MKLHLSDFGVGVRKLSKVVRSGRFCKTRKYAADKAMNLQKSKMVVFGK